MTADSASQPLGPVASSPAGLAARALTPIEIALTQTQARDSNCDCIVVTLDECGRLGRSAQVLDQRFDGLLSKCYAQQLISGALASSLVVPLFQFDSQVRCILLMGTGSDETISPEDYLVLVEATYQALQAHGVSEAMLYLTEVPVATREVSWKVTRLTQSYHEQAYQYEPQSRRSDASPAPLGTLYLEASAEHTAALQEGQASALAINLARQLADTPPNICTPSFLADVARDCADTFASLEVNVLDEAKMSELDMNVLLSVGRGSAEPSRLIEMRHIGTDPQTPPIVLVGKGITFDTGGTALKTRDAMRLMKYDMCGAATVIGMMCALASIDAPINVIGLCACAENMPGDAATRPSDVVRSMSGATVEIINPDAEGRLVLCDALTYAAQFDPSAIVDVATLTGASVVALGHHYSAMFANSTHLAEELLNAGEEALDHAWRMPLSKHDESQLESRFADCTNMGDGTAAAVVAALFLSKFTRDVPWAHLDISGPARKRGDKAVSTGRPGAMLLKFVLTRANQGASEAR